MKTISIIGGGASGFFCAINLKLKNPNLDITIFEAQTKALNKVKITGGGRCNLTNSFKNIKNLNQAYPRGFRLIDRGFRVFDYNQTFQWFENQGINLTTQEDQCVFPKSQDAMQIVNKLIELAENLGIKINLEHRLEKIIFQEDNTYKLEFKNGKNYNSDAVVISIGGHPKTEILTNIFEKLEKIKIIECIPSLFSFVIENDDLRALTGLVKENACCKIAGTKFESIGNLLITHQGMSGPAILKLSSYSARFLKENNYKATLIVNWVNQKFDEAIATINNFVKNNPKRLIGNSKIFDFTIRQWEYILKRCNINQETALNQIGKKQINKIALTITSDEYPISGQNTHKQEFVTCGGVDLNCINQNTLMAKEYPNLYFTGEVLDIDAITGGFNLQAAWTTAMMVVNNF